MEMGFICTYLFGMTDAALCADWFCQEPPQRPEPGRAIYPNCCFDKVSGRLNTSRTRARIQSQHDHKHKEYKATLHEALIHSIATRPDSAHLPDGLRVTEGDLERLAALDGDYSADTMQDEETVKAAFKLLRNYKRLPYYHCRDGVGVLWDYDELRTRLDDLARKK